MTWNARWRPDCSSRDGDVRRERATDEGSAVPIVGLSERRLVRLRNVDPPGDRCRPT